MCDKQSFVTVTSALSTAPSPYLHLRRQLNHLRRSGRRSTPGRSFARADKSAPSWLPAVPATRAENENVCDTSAKLIASASGVLLKSACIIHAPTERCRSGPSYTRAGWEPQPGDRAQAARGHNVSCRSGPTFGIPMT